MYSNLDPSLHPPPLPPNSQAQSGVLGWLSNGFVSALPQPSGSPLPGRANSDSRVSMEMSECDLHRVLLGFFLLSVHRCGRCLGPVIFIPLFNISSSCYSRSIIITMTMMVENWHKDITIKSKHNLFVLLIFVSFFLPAFQSASQERMEKGMMIKE